MRETPSIFAFPLILTLHTIGMGVVAGINTALALRLLGVARDIPLTAMQRYVPFMWAGFWLNAVSGVALLIAYPTKALTNPLFYVKLGLIGFALWNVTAIRRFAFEDQHSPHVPGRAKRLAVASLVCWAGVIFSGRFLAYTYTHLLADR
jgi:hypothetical protein